MNSIDVSIKDVINYSKLQGQFPLDGGGWGEFYIKEVNSCSLRPPGVRVFRVNVQKVSFWSKDLFMSPFLILGTTLSIAMNLRHLGSPF